MKNLLNRMSGRILLLTFLITGLTGQEVISQNLFDIYAKRDLQKFEKVVQKKPDLVHEKDKGTPIIQLVTRNNSMAFLKVLVDHGADVDQPDNLYLTPLYYAVSNGNKEITTYLLEYQANINIVDTDSNNLLILAVNKNDMEICKILIQYQINVDFRNPSGFNAFSIACLNENKTMATYLLSVKKKVLPVDMAVCIGMNYPELLQELSNKGGDLRTSGPEGIVMLDAAVLGEKIDMVNFLLERGFDVNEPDKEGATPLMYATLYNDDIEISKKLIASGAKINAGNQEGYTPLMYALFYEGPRSFDGIKQKIRLFLDHGALIDQTDQKGNTALMYAASLGLKSIASLLVEAGADPKLLNNEGLSAATFAKKAKRPGTQKFMQKLQKK